MKFSAIALFAFVAAAFALKNDATPDNSLTDSTDIDVSSGDIYPDEDYDEDDAAIDAGAAYFASLDEEDQAAVIAYVADQLDDGDDDAAAAADDSPEVSQGN
ncbi:Aste57867_22804 [Aphanomyces stellatus]|uniref:Aste57867_16825 protein n=1 Tax=Aphanomyces stellatus TaxID=120398 RepID=A0A485KBI9_9STRA|nr:hypothetical protein As57867_022734 [Aphanomyces stellatus]KAF0692036.1 hypothetical protein As57867_016767 [Aphanomyces stellatus]KAF0709251.1 hypothetical protein As57867_006010 [Aphanomyces stellatus]KAF0709254.1 hypothetical protein As57867_006013 [Aphanomyces stellatus]KAF0715256.1 hypothetical protein As57867_003478 [Aphanomyces stellatus]